MDSGGGCPGHPVLPAAAAQDWAD